MNTQFLMQRAVVYLVLLVSAGGIAAGQQARVEQEQEISGYLRGEYELIGRLPDSVKVFRGTVRLAIDGNRLRMERTINGRTVIGKARLDTSGPDRVEVLRASFTIDGKDYEATYLWRSDLDNYPIVTGRVFSKETKSPGVETWFPNAGQ